MTQSADGIEPPTPALQMPCSAAELCRHKTFLSVFACIYFDTFSPLLIVTFSCYDCGTDDRNLFTHTTAVRSVLHTGHAELASSGCTDAE